MPKPVKKNLPKKNLILLLIALGIAVPSGSFVTYKYITPNAVQSTYFNKTTVLAGDGTHQAKIELTLLNGLNEPMSNVNITPTASVGNVSSCTTTSGGTCFITYTPPKTANNESATIFISIGNFHQNMQFAITPDQTTQIKLSSNATQIYANSSARVTAILKDAFGNPIPNGAQVNFSLQGGGSLSATSCFTINGQCSVNYTSSSTASTATVYASASSVNQQINIGVVSHQGQVSLSANREQVYTNGGVVLNVTLKDGLGNLVPNGTQVNFSSQNGGQFSSNSCLTINGQCSVDYIAPSTSGSAVIEASSGDSYDDLSINVKSRLIQTQIFSLGNSGTYCNGAVPYYAINLNLYSGENVTWDISSSIGLQINGAPEYLGDFGLTHTIYVFNTEQYSTFSNLVSNATSQYKQFLNRCFTASGAINYPSYNQSNATTLYCVNGESKFGYPDGNGVYANISEQINPNYLAYGIGATNESFIAQNSGIYYLVIFIPNLAIATFGTPPICFSSTAYNTTVYTGS